MSVGASSVSAVCITYFQSQALGYSNSQKAIRDHVTEDDKTVNDSFIVNGTKGVLIIQYRFVQLDHIQQDSIVGFYRFYTLPQKLVLR